MACLSGFELYSRWVPLNFVDIAQNPSLAIYKIVLVFAFRLVRWDGR